MTDSQPPLTREQLIAFCEYEAGIVRREQPDSPIGELRAQFFEAIAEALGSPSVPETDQSEVRQALDVLEHECRTTCMPFEGESAGCVKRCPFAVVIERALTLPSAPVPKDNQTEHEDPVTRVERNADADR